MGIKNTQTRTTGKADNNGRRMHVSTEAIDAAFANLALDTREADNLREVGKLLCDFCDLLWDWHVLFINVRRSRASHEFPSVLLIDTIDGQKVVLPDDEFTPQEVSKNWKRLLKNEPVLINREKAQDYETDAPTFGSHQRSASLVFVPIESRSRVEGIISIQSYMPHYFNMDDCELLRRAGAIAAPALLRCRSEERMREFLHLGERLNQVIDPGGVARVVANAATKLLGWSFISVHTYDPATRRLQLVLGYQRSTSTCRIYPPQESIVDENLSTINSVLNGTTLLIDDKVKPGSAAPFDTQLPLLSTAVLSPVRSLNRVVGLLCVQNSFDDAYDTEDVGIARGLADYCGGSLERAWADQNLKLSQANYQLVVENVNDGIVISQDDHFVFFNNQFAQMLGYQPAELRKKTYEDIYSSVGLEILKERTKRRHAGEAVPDRYETVFCKKSGDLLPVEANVRIIPTYNGRNATFAVIRDISERKAAEEQLRKSDEELRTLFNAMTDTILVLDWNGRYLRHRSTNRDAITKRWVDVEGKLLHDFFPKEKADNFLSLVRRAIESNEVLNIEYDLETKEKELRWYNTSISPLSGQTVLMVVRDVTETRQAEDELFRSNARYKALIDGSEDYIFVLDNDFRFLHVNSAIEKRYKARAEDRIGKTFQDIFGDNLPVYSQAIKSVFDTGTPTTYDDDALINGEWLCTETVISPVFDRSGNVEAILGVSRDVTSRRKSELDLKISEQRYAVAVRGANDGIWDWNLETDTLYLSPRWWAIVGEDSDKMEIEQNPDSWFQRVHPGDILAVHEKIDNHINGQTSHLEVEHRIRNANGTFRWVLCRGLCVRNNEGKAVQMAGSLTDITDRKITEEQLHYGATHDALTNLPNRAYFLDLLKKAMARAKRTSASAAYFAVLFLDLDRFKVINDSLGHLAGDEMIKTMARRLENCIRPGDTVARMGGDEFTVLLENLAQNLDAIHITERIIREINAPIYLGEVAVHSTASIGIAFARPEYESPNELLRDADTAMYRAKATGRNRYQVFDQQMHDRAMSQLLRETDLRKAVALQQFEMFYQPVYNIQTGRLSGFEGLIRWNHPGCGLIFPGDFIPLAEETGLIVPMGWWVIDEVSKALAEWNMNRPAGHKFTMSINMSPRQISQSDVAAKVCFIVENNGAKPENVIIEITENVLMEDSQHIKETLAGLRDCGIRIDLDDFGTGYSSLSYLRRYPIDLLKIDRSFVCDLGKRDDSRQIVKAMLDLAAGLGLQVTAEGVETIEQLTALKEMNCDFAQGYYFSRPVPKSRIEEIIKNQSLFSQVEN